MQVERLHPRLDASKSTHAYFEARFRFHNPEYACFSLDSARLSCGYEDGALTGHFQSMLTFSDHLLHNKGVLTLYITSTYSHSLAQDSSPIGQLINVQPWHLEAPPSSGPLVRRWRVPDRHCLDRMPHQLVQLLDVSGDYTMTSRSVLMNTAVSFGLSDDQRAIQGKRHRLHGSSTLD